MKKSIAALLGTAMLLSACSNGEEMPTGFDTNTYVDYIVTGQEYATLNYLNSWSGADFRVTANLIDGLLEYDKYGNLGPSLAETWEHNDDCSVWTFHLRQGAYWYTSDKEKYAEVTADDFVYAAEFILDPINASGNVNSYIGVIEGAAEYFAAKSDGKEADFSTVGVKALDKYTVQYVMANGKGTPYFGSAVTYAAYEPANRDYVESQEKTDAGTSKFGIDKDHILYNGGYILDACTLEQEKTFVKNEGYWDADNITIDTVKVLYFKDQESVYEAFKRGDTSYAPLLSSQAKKLYDENNKYLIQTDLAAGNRVISMNNQTLYSEDVNRAMSNLNFRKSLFYGFDRTMYNEVSNPINPSSIEAYAFSGVDFVYTTDGTDYTQLGNLKQWQSPQYDMTKAEEYKAKAIEELEAEGVSFPLELIYQYKAGNETEANRATMIKESIEALGTDYVTVTLKEYQTWADVRAAGDYAFTVGGWSPDWADPVNNLTCLKTNAGTVNYYDEPLKAGSSHWNYPEFDAMVEAGDKIIDTDARYEAFANAEAWLLENAYIIPIYQNGGTYQLTTVNNYSKVHTGVGLDQFKWKGMELYDHVITTEENEKLKTEWQAAREKAMQGQE